MGGAPPLKIAKTPYSFLPCKTQLKPYLKKWIQRNYMMKFVSSYNGNGTSYA